MEYLLSPKNLKILESFAFASTVYGFDFDGTLASIVKNPDDAKMSERVESSVVQLNNLVPVAIITGRSVTDIKKRLAFTPAYVIGNHGMEGFGDMDEETVNLKKTQGFKDQLLNKYENDFKYLGIDLENKGHSLTMHYRNAPDTANAQRFLSVITKELVGAHVSEGKMVFNILPTASVTKGEAFIRIMKSENAKFGFYIGDDETDEDVFKQKDPNIISVRVGWSATSQARFYLKDQNEIEILLSSLLKLMQLNTET
jgi:trehalose 6-phosphate phosphatase